MELARIMRTLWRLAGNVVRGRIARRAVDRMLATRPPLEPGTVHVVVHFPDHLVNLYQLQQWYRPIEELAQQHPVVVVARYATTARVLLDECPVPVVLCRSIASVERLLTAHPVRAVLYVNQNIRNFSVMRYAEPAHVFICHGESDKVYMSSNQLKAYDVTFVAGQAAVDRIRRRLVGYDVDARTVRIGRPQVDVTYPGPSLPDDGRLTVLYAPTWEGDRPTMSYGSVLSHGEALVRSLLDDPGLRVVFRPHPRTGTVDPAVARALRRTQALVEAATSADPAARHIAHDRTPFGWHLAAADVCITDVSAVAYDWLATGKPLMITRPASPEAVIPETGLTTALDLLPATAAGEAGTIVRRLVEEGRDEARAALVEHYFGDTSPGASMRRFLTAVDKVVTSRDAELAALRARG